VGEVKIEWACSISIKNPPPVQFKQHLRVHLEVYDRPSGLLLHDCFNMWGFLHKLVCFGSECLLRFPKILSIAGGAVPGTKFCLTLNLLLSTDLSCAGISGARSFCVIGPFGLSACLNRLPDAGTGDEVVPSAKKGKPELRKKSE
jgi:hypothetical protein